MKQRSSEDEGRAARTRAARADGVRQRRGVLPGVGARARPGARHPLLVPGGAARRGRARVSRALGRHAGPARRALPAPALALRRDARRRIPASLARKRRTGSPRPGCCASSASRATPASRCARATAARSACCPPCTTRPLPASARDRALLQASASRAASELAQMHFSAELEASEALTRGILEAMRDAILVLRTDGTVAFHNGAACELFRTDAFGLSRATIAELLPDLDRAAARDRRRRRGCVVPPARQHRAARQDQGRRDRPRRGDDRRVRAGRRGAAHGDAAQHRAAPPRGAAAARLRARARARERRPGARAPQGRARGRGEDRVPRQHEPRDPHADDRDPRLHRHPARGGAAERGARAARRAAHDPPQRRLPARDPERHPRLLEDRGEPARDRAAAVLAAPDRERRRRAAAPARGGEGRAAARRHPGGRARSGCMSDPVRLRQILLEPDRQRGEVHARRGRSAWRCASTRRTRRSSSTSRTPGSGSRPRRWCRSSSRSGRATAR